MIKRPKKKEADRFAAHTTNVALWFTRDIIGKEYKAVDMYNDRAAAGVNDSYKVRYPWTPPTDRSGIERRERRKLLAREYEVDYPWTSARVDRADLDGSSLRGDGVRTFADYHDSGAVVFGRPWGVLEEVPAEASAPRKPRRVPHHLRALMEERKQVPWWETMGLGYVKGQPEFIPDQDGRMRYYGPDGRGYVPSAPARRRRHAAVTCSHLVLVAAVCVRRPAAPGSSARPSSPPTRCGKH